MVGDYKCVNNVRNVEENYRNKRSLELSQLVQAFELCDTFWRLHPQAREYTYYRTGSSSARLDRIYVKQDMVQQVVEVVHVPTLRSLSSNHAGGDGFHGTC